MSITIMPNYDYKCQRCNFCFSKIRSMKESALPAKCPKCEGMGRRSFSFIKRVAIIFKGEGFYTTDSRKGRKNDS